VTTFINTSTFLFYFIIFIHLVLNRAFIEQLKRKKNIQNNLCGVLSYKERHTMSIEFTNDEALVLEPREVYDPAIIGICFKSGRVIYSIDKLIECTMNHYIDVEKDLDEHNKQTLEDLERIETDANEWVSFNILGAYMGELEPIYLHDSNFIEI